MSTELSTWADWGRFVLHYPFLELGGIRLTSAGIIQFLCAVAFIFVAERAMRRHLFQRLLRRTQLNPAVQFAISKIVGYAFIALGLFVTLKVAGIDLSALALALGAVGVGLGFGLQNITSNFISGLIILAERPIAIGDRVEVDGVAGQITRISLRSTTVVTNDNICIIVPNSNFISQSVINWSHGDPKVQFRLPVSVAYGTDTEKLRGVLLAVAAAHPKVLKEPAPSVYFEAFGDSALKFELGVWTAEMTFSPRRFRSELNFAMERALRENAIQIPFPQRDLHVRTGSLVLAADGETGRPPPPLGSGQPSADPR